MDLLADLPAITAPTLVIAGAEDSGNAARAWRGYCGPDLRSAAAGGARRRPPVESPRRMR